MCLRLVQLNVLLTIAMADGDVVNNNASSACDKGWFGDSCRYKCHCANSETCEPDGECPNNGGCSRGFFGPACQYVDQAVKANNDTEPYLTDENDDTCNFDEFATSASVMFDQAITITWVRIHVRMPHLLNNFTLIFNGNDPCSNERRFDFSTTAVDVTCDIDYRVSELELRGPAASHVCSIYISGGRNVALRQTAVQTSVFPNHGEAYKAVDGVVHPSNERPNCAHTKNEPHGAEWYLQYDRPYMILKVVVYNRSIYGYRIRNFTIDTTTEKGTLTNNYIERRDPSSKVFDIYFSSRTPIVRLTIRRTQRDYVNTTILTMCEVETYGEAVCPDNYYGLWCNKTCSCKLQETCFTVTGACSIGCHIGDYGFKCLKHCSPNCLQGYCYQRLGICESCTLGYSGAYCTKECEDGMYGFDCQKICSNHCLEVCNNRDGGCQCQKPYAGRTCTGCVPGRYGVTCSKNCSEDCLDGKCHLDTGVCKSCKGKRIGDFCDDCPPGLYGTFCLSSCSEFCFNGTCDVDNGTCPICINGYTGDRCKTGPSEKSTPWRVVIPVAAVVSFILVTGCALMCRNINKPRSSFIDDQGTGGSELADSNDTDLYTQITLDQPNS